MTAAATRYAPIERDCYFTPVEGIRPLLARLPVGLMAGHLVRECAAGDGFLAAHLEESGLTVVASDIAPPRATFRDVETADFLSSSFMTSGPALSFITNPPYGVQHRLAVAFLHHAMAYAEATGGLVAFLLPFEFDAAASRDALAGGHKAFAAKITIGARLRWRNIDQSGGVPPRFHHAWYVWAFDAELRAAIRAGGMMRTQ